MREILLIAILLLSGCIETEKQENPLLRELNVTDINISEPKDLEQNQSVSQRQRAYLPFQKNLNEKNSVALYRTDGTVKGTSLIYEEQSNSRENFEYHVLKNFTIFGAYVYYDFVEEKLSFDSSRIKQLRMHIATEHREVSTEIESSSTNHPRVNRVEVNGHLYVKTLNDNFYASLIKYNDTGEYENINISNTSKNYISLTNTPMVGLNDNLYMVALSQNEQPILVMLRTSDETFHLIPIESELQGIQLYALGDTIYLLVRNLELEHSQLWSYNSKTKALFKSIYTFKEIPYGVEFPKDAGYVDGEKLYIKSPQKSTLALLCFDTNSSQMVNLLEKKAKTIDEFITYKGKTLFTVDNLLWQSDGTRNGTRPLFDNNNDKISATALTVIGERLYFVAQTVAYGKEPWVYDGNSSTLLMDINQGEASSSPSHMTELNEGIVFQATSDGKNNKLFYYHDKNLTVLK